MCNSSSEAPRSMENAEFVPSPSSSVLPRLPLLTSQADHWQGIQIEYHQQPAWTTPIHSHAEHVLMLCRFDQPAQVELILHEQAHYQITEQECLITTPALRSHQERWNQPLEMIWIGLHPDFVDAIAKNSMPNRLSRDRVQLLPHLTQADPFLSGIGIALKRELETYNVRGRLYIDSLITALIVYVLHHYSDAALNQADRNAIKFYPNGLSPYQLKCILDYIQAHLSDPIRLDELAMVLRMNRYRFSQQFKQSMGLSPYQYVLYCRVEQAKVLLRAGGAISEVAMECGFANQSHFTHHFRRLTGATPKTYQNY